MDQTLHPRPQLQRATWQSLDGQWRFTFDDQGRHELPGDIRDWHLRIQVPFAPESERSGIGDTGFHPVCWYEREFEAPPGEGRVLLHFGAVDYQARVWVNDQLVVEHEGGHTPFTADITRALRPDGPQRVTVQALDDPHDLAKPRGKQDWMLEPHSIWYPRTSGIWQTVWLERVPETYLERLRWTPDLVDWEITMEAYIAGDLSHQMRIGVRLSHGEQILADDNYAVIYGEVVRRIVLADPGIDDYRNELLWSPESPKLIQAEVTLWDGDRLVDRVQSYTALRAVYVQRDRFMLNGRPYYLRLVLDQGYWPDTLMTPPSDEALRRDIELVKAMGFNGVRKHQKIEDPRFLYWADTLGLVVWEEMPSAYRFTSRAVQRLMREWKEVIDRDYSHPCIVVWVPFNESWGVPDLPQTAEHRDAVQAFYHLTKTLDPTRPVIGNDGWESTATDIIGIHDYDRDPSNFHERYGPKIKPEELFDRRRPGGRILTLDGYPHRGQPIMLTEFGGIALSRTETPEAEGIWGYSSTSSVQDFERRYTAYLETVRDIGMFSGFCYTQFTDTFQEANGLLYADRTPKIPIAAIRKATCGSD
ncbi:MAG: glycoside hydrolase family 2 TIM barrel-domain containing protein [Pseudomonadota bacterium]